MQASEPADETLSVAKELGGAFGVPCKALLAGVMDVRVYAFLLQKTGLHLLWNCLSAVFGVAVSPALDGPAMPRGLRFV